MAHILIMPRQGNTVESCVLVEWKVNEGDTVNEESIVCKVETDKAAFEVPAGANGTILKILCEEGDDIPVLDPIAVIGIVGEDWKDLIKGTGNREQGNNKQLEISNEKLVMISNNEQTDNSSPALNFLSAGLISNSSFTVSPRAKSLMQKEALNMSEIGSGSGPGGRIIERDVIQVLKNRPALTAAAKAVKPSAIPVSGSGIGGRITTEDLKSPTSIPNSSPALKFLSAGLISNSLKGIRKLIADRMHKSLAETAQFTLNACAPVSRMQDLRARINNSSEETLTGDIKTNIPKISVNDMILFAVSRVLPDFLFMNAHKVDNTIIEYNEIHLGLAVDTPRGLMVPVIRNANMLSVTQISAEAKRLAKACQEGNIKPEELSGSTFTVTNLGHLGVTGFTPILNIPEVAILGVCNIELKPVIQDESQSLITHIPHIGFSLTINHQAVDGAPAARFLKALCEKVEKIDMELSCTM